MPQTSNWYKFWNATDLKVLWICRFIPTISYYSPTFIPVVFKSYFFPTFSHNCAVCAGYTALICPMFVLCLSVCLTFDAVFPGFPDPDWIYCIHLSDVRLVSVHPSDVWCCLSGLSWPDILHSSVRCSSCVCPSVWCLMLSFRAFLTGYTAFFCPIFILCLSVHLTVDAVFQGFPDWIYCIHLSDVHLVSVCPSDVRCCLSGLSWLDILHSSVRCSSCVCPSVWRLMLSFRAFLIGYTAFTCPMFILCLSVRLTFDAVFQGFPDFMPSNSVTDALATAVGAENQALHQYTRSFVSASLQWVYI